MIKTKIERNFKEKPKTPKQINTRTKLNKNSSNLLTKVKLFLNKNQVEQKENISDNIKIEPLNIQNTQIKNNQRKIDFDSIEINEENQNNTKKPIITVLKESDTRINLIFYLQIYPLFRRKNFLNSF